MRILVKTPMLRNVLCLDRTNTNLCSMIWYILWLPQFPHIKVYHNILMFKECSKWLRKDGSGYNGMDKAFKALRMWLSKMFHLCPYEPYLFMHYVCTGAGWGGVSVSPARLTGWCTRKTLGKQRQHTKEEFSKSWAVRCSTGGPQYSQ